MFAGVVRLLGMYCLPLMDPSESRYAEIARKMVATGDWVTLWSSYGIPFWAKPPLSTWAAATGLSVCGINAFAVRLPTFLVALGVIGLVMSLARSRPQTELPLLSALVLLTSTLFYIVSGSVLTDITLTFGTTLSMVAFWHTMRGAAPSCWRYLFFVGLAIGFLSKGPIALIFTGVPVFIWGVSQVTLLELWKKVPWISGGLLVLILTVPWFVLAEMRTPGFLEYFFVDEHFKRFLIKGWSGDLYGNGHPYPKGTIWLFWLGGMFPWSLWGIYLTLSSPRRRGPRPDSFFYLLSNIFSVSNTKKKVLSLGPRLRGDDKERDGDNKEESENDGWTFYLLLWTLTPLIFFTVCSNITMAYPLPAIPAFSLLIAYGYLNIKDTLWKQRAFLGSCLIPPCLMGIIVSIFLLNPSLFYKFVLSQKEVAESFSPLQKEEKGKLIYWCKGAYSIEFYSAGQARLVRDIQEFQKALGEEKDPFIALDGTGFSQLPQDIRDRLIFIQKPNARITIYKLNKEELPR